MDTVALLANERRARLAAERLLEMRQRELKLANQKLSDHARSLSGQIMAKRQEMEDIQAQTSSLRDEYVQTQGDLARAHSAAELAERRLWSALQSVRDGFALFDSEHKLVVANKAYLAIFDGLECVRPGITYPEIVQILVEEGIIDPQGPTDAWVDKMITRWHSDSRESVIVRLWNGQFVKVMDNRTPEGGTVTLGINQTDQLRMWAAVETIADGFVLFDQEDRLVMCNAQFRDMYDLPMDEVPNGSTFESILRITLANGRVADAKGREDQWLEERLSEHRRPSGSIEQQLSDGRWLRIVERATPDGGRVGLRVDITEIKRQQAALEAERERAETANRAKSAFLANMSHEIRTPMNGVVGMADLLKGSALTSEQELYVDTIRSSGEALLAVLNDILDFSKIEANKAELTIAPFNLEDCLHDVVCLLKPMVATAPIRLDVAFDPAQPSIVQGDASRVRQILLNIMGNALKFTQKGSVAVRVAPRDGGVRIEIEDTGIGIPESKLEHIFGEFNQVEDDRNRKYDGTGLGLAICRQLADQMGGAISVTSTIGHGSCFAIDLPLPAALDQSGVSKLVPGLSRAIIFGPKTEAREGLIAHLAQLGIKASVARKSPKKMEAGCIVFLMSEAGDPKPPAFPVAPGAFILISSKPPSNGAKGFDAHVSQPVSRSALVRTLNTLQKTKGPKGAAAPTLRQLYVLAAEDNKTNQLVLGKMLKTADIRLHVVSDGAQAVAAFTKDRPDLIFMDISMPGMDGREATRQIRAHEAKHNLPHTPIVAMTAHDMDSDKEEIAAAGIDHHLSKPLNRDALLAHIETVRAARQEVG